MFIILYQPHARAPSNSSRQKCTFIIIIIITQVLYLSTNQHVNLFPPTAKPAERDEQPNHCICFTTIRYEMNKGQNGACRWRTSKLSGGGCWCRISTSSQPPKGEFKLNKSYCVCLCATVHLLYLLLLGLLHIILLQGHFL